MALHAAEEEEEVCISAAQAVFQIAELVENIVGRLSPRNIFGVLRVSKAVHAVIKSPVVREKLFLQSSRKPTSVWTNPGGKIHVMPVTPSPFIDLEGRPGPQRLEYTSSGAAHVRLSVVDSKKTSTTVSGPFPTPTGGFTWAATQDSAGDGFLLMDSSVLDT